MNYNASKTRNNKNSFLIRNLAIKIPSFVQWSLFLHGLLANMNETKFSVVKSFGKLCPVIFSVPGGFLNVMLRCEPLTMEEFVSHNVELEDFGVAVEPKLDSVGWLNGEIVAVDYGN